MTLYRPTKAKISLRAIEHNLSVLKEAAGSAELIAVVKADAYGHGAAAVARKAEESGIRLLAVATPDEAVALREDGIKADILVMGASPAAFIPHAQRERFILTAVSLQWIGEAAEAADGQLPPARIHLKVDTGMGRLGVQPEEVQEAFSLLRQSSFSFEGIFTHFATADEANSELLKVQADKFTDILQKEGANELLVHAANSAATLIHPDLSFQAVRTGISLYGIAPSSYVEQEMNVQLKPALSLETELVHVKKMPAGSTVSYGATYRLDQEEWIGTLPIGYADGLLRGLQGQEVLIRGKRVPIIGRICMDQCMVRLPEEMQVGERVQLIGKQGEEHIRVEEWAEKLQTIPYEIPCILTARIPRIMC